MLGSRIIVNKKPSCYTLCLAHSLSLYVWTSTYTDDNIAHDFVVCRLTRSTKRTRKRESRVWGITCTLETKCMLMLLLLWLGENSKSPKMRLLSRNAGSECFFEHCTRNWKTTARTHAIHLDQIQIEKHTFDHENLENPLSLCFLHSCRMWTI